MRPSGEGRRLRHRQFLCPTPAARAAFLEGGDAFIVWVGRIKESAFEDTNRMFVPPEHCNLRISPEGAAEYWTEEVAKRVRLVFNSKAAAAIFIGPLPAFP